MSTHNICFHGEIRKMIYEYPLLSDLWYNENYIPYGRGGVGWGWGVKQVSIKHTISYFSINYVLCTKKKERKKKTAVTIAPDKRGYPHIVFLISDENRFCVNSLELPH